MTTAGRTVSRREARVNALMSHQNADHRAGVSAAHRHQNGAVRFLVCLLPCGDNLMSRSGQRWRRPQRLRRRKPRRLIEWEDDHECDWEIGQPLEDDAAKAN